MVLALERIANPDNVGGIFRCAAAFGADAVLLDPATTDPLYRKAIRTSMGAALVVPFARTQEWPTALSELRARGFAVAAMTPDTFRAGPECNRPVDLPTVPWPSCSATRATD